MKTKSTKTKVNQWVLKNRETGKVYSNWTYPSRQAARKAAKGRRFKGLYVPVKSGDGGIDPKKLKKTKPAPTPKSVAEIPTDVNGIISFKSFLDWLFSDESSEPEVNVQTAAAINESNVMTKTNVNTKPKLRKASSAPGATFGVRCK